MLVVIVQCDKCGAVKRGSTPERAMLQAFGSGWQHGKNEDGNAVDYCLKCTVDTRAVVSLPSVHAEVERQVQEQLAAALSGKRPEARGVEESSPSAAEEVQQNDAPDVAGPPQPGDAPAGNDS